MSALEFRGSQRPTLWQNNPVLVQLLGLSPLLAVSTSAASATGLGVATGMVLVLAAITIALIRNLIGATWRFVVYLVVLAVYTTVLDRILQWYFLPLHKALGLYLPLIVCNMALLVHLDCQSRRQSPLVALGTAGVTAAGFLFALVGFAMAREWLGTGRVFMNAGILLPSPLQVGAAPVSAATPRLFHFALLSPAAFILLGLLLALKNAVTGNRPGPATDRPVTPVPRARVTGNIPTS